MDKFPISCIMAGAEGPTPRLRRPLAVGYHWLDEDQSLAQCQITAALLRKEMRHVHGRREPGAVSRYEAARRTEGSASIGRRGQ